MVAGWADGTMLVAVKDGVLSGLGVLPSDGRRFWILLQLVDYKLRSLPADPSLDNP